MPTLQINLTAVVLILSLGVSSWLIYGRYQRAKGMRVYERMLLHRQFEEREHFRRLELEEKLKEEYGLSKKLEEIISEKSQRFLSIPSISFYFVNEAQVKSFYNDYFREPTIESLVSEVVGEITGEIKGSIPKILESRIGGKDLNKWISTIKLPDISLSGMFQRYQRETIKNKQVVLGIEEVEIELNELQAFDDTVAELEKRFDLKLEERLLSHQRTHLKEKAAERTLSKLEQATGWVLVEGRFKIEEEGDFYKCTYLHPVNEYLSEQIGPVTISVLLRKDSLEAHIAGNYAQSIGRVIPLRIYGQVWEPVDMESSAWDLKLSPLAIY